MNEAINRNHLKILGTSASAGGYFLDVKVTGECRFNGDVDCQKISLTGETEVSGNLRMENMKITGQCAVKGRIDGESLRGQGDIKAGGGLSIEKIKLAGNLEVSGDCEAEELHITGALQVDGLLNAEKLELSLFGPGRAAEVGGSSISIKRSRTGALLKLGQAKKMMFTARVIEGDQLELQGTKAEVVRGGRVIIGAGCDIDTVEYRDTLEIHKSAVVRKYMKML